MGQYLLMPKLDMSMKEGTIVSWLVEKGDEIKKGENVFEVETGKVSIEVDNTALSGKVLGIYYEEGDTVEINTPVMYIGSSGETAPGKEESLEYFRQLKKENSDIIEEHGYDYDVLIIGAGQAGYTFALHAAKYTSSIAIIEKGDFGGVCLNRGCIPSRFFHSRAEKLADIYDIKDYDITAEVSSFDYSLSVRKKDELIKKLRSSMKHALTGCCDVYEADAAILAENVVKVADEIITAKYIIISSGSSPCDADIISDESISKLTTEEVLCLERLPQRAVFCGESAYILEQAMMYRSFGVDVTVISGIAPTKDDYLNRQIKKLIQKKKISVINEKITEIRNGNLFLEGGKSIPSDIFVYENRRKANIVPSETAFEITDEGFYLTDESFMTSVPGIYAIGDANGLSLTAQGAGSDAQELAEILFAGKEPERKVYPKCINIFPKVAYVGYTESELDKMGIKYISSRRSLSSHPAAMASSSQGFLKLICDSRFGEILGFQIISDDADEIIGIISLAMKNELTADELAKNIFIHPTIGEMITTASSEIAEKLGMEV